MGRPKNTPLRIALRGAKRTRDKIAALPRDLHPKWHDKMMAYWNSEVERLTDAVKHERSAH